MTRAAPILLAVAIVVFRLAQLSGSEVMRTMANFTPLIAVAVCGAATLRPRVAWGVTVGAFVVSDLVLNAAFGLAWFSATTAMVLCLLVVALAIGHEIKGSDRLAPFLFGTLAGATVFYLVSNTVVFFTAKLPSYPPTWAGWWQCMTIGHPQFATPTIVFFLKSIVGNGLFAALYYFVFVKASAASRAESQTAVCKATGA